MVKEFLWRDAQTELIWKAFKHSEMILDKNGCTLFNDTRFKFSFHLDVFPSYFLTQKDDLLPSLNTGTVVRHIHDLQLLLGLNQWLRSKSYHMIVTNLSIKDWMWHHRVQNHCVFTRTCRILQKCLNTEKNMVTKNILGQYIYLKT